MVKVSSSHKVTEFTYVAIDNLKLLHLSCYEKESIKVRKRQKLICC